MPFDFGSKGQNNKNAGEKKRVRLKKEARSGGQLTQKAGKPRPYRSTTRPEPQQPALQLDLDLDIVSMDPNAVISDQELEDYKNAFAVFVSISSFCRSMT